MIISVKKTVLFLILVVALWIILKLTVTKSIELFAPYTEDPYVLPGGSDGWTKYTKPNYYGWGTFGTFGRHYGHPYYFRKGDTQMYAV